jgi:hypothetical protein
MNPIKYPMIFALNLAPANLTVQSLQNGGQGLGVLA